MATTYLQAVNQVLRKLREREVTSVGANSYAQLIGTFVNDAIREVEGRWDFLGLRNSVVVDTQASTFRYAFINVGPDAKLIYDSVGNPSVFNDTQDYHLQKAPSSRWMTSRLNQNNSTNGQPLYFDFVGIHNGELVVDLWPVPDATYTISFDMIVPQGTITSDTEVIKVPAHPVVIGAYARAVYERGEDQGYLSDLAWREYEKAVGDAIAMDMMNSSDDLTWRPV